MTIEELRNLSYNFSKYRIELQNKLRNFQESFNELKENFEDTDLFDCNDFICDNYPFEKSFDEIMVDDWINSINDKLTKKHIEIVNIITKEIKSSKKEYYQINFLEEIVSFLNNYMEADKKFWEWEFGCDTEEVVSKHGFYYDNEGRIFLAEIDNACRVNIPFSKLQELYEYFKVRPLQEIRIFIYWIQYIID